MRITFTAGNYILWAAFAASITIAILHDFSSPTLTLMALVIVALGYWLAKHRKELRAAYEKAEVIAAVPGPYDKQIWGHKPALRDLAPGMAAIGFVCLYFAYDAANGNPLTSRIANFIHQLFGLPGVVAYWAMLGSAVLAKATETIIGSRLER